MYRGFRSSFVSFLVSGPTQSDLSPDVPIEARARLALAGRQAWDSYVTLLVVEDLLRSQDIGGDVRAAAAALAEAWTGDRDVLVYARLLTDLVKAWIQEDMEHAKGARILPPSAAVPAWITRVVASLNATRDCVNAALVVSDAYTAACIRALTSLRLDLLCVVSDGLSRDGSDYGTPLEG